MACSLVATIAMPRWRLCGIAFGPARQVEVRVSYDPETGFASARVDGQPLGELTRQARQQIEAAQIELMREFRGRRDASTRHLRRSAGKPTTAVIGHGSAPHARDEQIQATAQIAALRERRRREVIQARHTALEPLDAPAVARPFSEDSSAILPIAPTSDAKTASSVFRCDKQQTTDRIARLRQAKPTDEAKPQKDELTTRMERLRRRQRDSPLGQDEPS